MVKFIAILILLLTCFNEVKADEPTHKLSSYEGLHFYVGFMENESRVAAPGKVVEMKIFISSSYKAHVSISYAGQQPKSYVLDPNKVYDYIYNTDYENYESEQVTRKVFEINSDVPIAVSAISSMDLTSDCYAAVPVVNWGTDYAIITLPNDRYAPDSVANYQDSVSSYTPRSGEFMVMAAYDSTYVTITPASDTRVGRKANTPFTIYLKKGECYLVQSYPFDRGLGDLTGTTIKATKPVGVLTGHVRTALLQGFKTQPPDSKDHLLEMLAPVKSWGKSFVTAPFGTSPNKGDYFKAVATDSNTRVVVTTTAGSSTYKFNNATKTLIIPGINQPATWQATGPIEIAQFMMRTGDSLEENSYDPCMAIIPPTEQFIQKVLFSTPLDIQKEPDKYGTHGIILIADSVAASRIKINNVRVGDISAIDNQLVANTHYHWANVIIQPGTYELQTDSGYFSGLVYGRGKFDSYGMVLGMALKPPDATDNVPPSIKVNTTCLSIDGKVWDDLSNGGFGIFYARILEDSTYNFDWTIDPAEPDADTLYFHFHPLDIFKDGRIMMEYADQFGNKKIYTYYHDAIKLDFDTSVDFGTIDWKDSSCQVLTIRNKGKKSISLENIVIANDNRVTFKSLGTSSVVIPAGDSVQIKVCFRPGGTLEDLQTTLNLKFDCDLSYDIPLTGAVVQIELATAGHDFGDVMIGDTVCSVIKIINNGNIDINLLNILFDDNGVFVPDTAGLFPYLLKKGDTLDVPVCFIPDSRVNYAEDIAFINNINVTKKADVSGRGIAPLVKNVIIDWGKRRIGTQSDTTVSFQNDGNTQAIISLDNFLIKQADDTTAGSIQSIDNLIIPQSGSTDHDFSFKPETTGPYLTKGLLKTNWKLHDSLTVTCMGIGTVPIINTLDVDFGTIDIYTQKDTVADVIKNTGNETLTIDSIAVGNGDINSFSVQFDTLMHKQVTIDGIMQLASSFKPRTLGLHQLELLVTHDANPAYQRSISKIILKGRATTPNKLDLKMEADKVEVPACNNDYITVTLTNTSSIPLEVDTLKLDVAGTIRAEIENFVSPLTLDTNESIQFRIKVFGMRGDSGIVNITAICYDEFNITKSIPVKTKSQELKIDNHGVFAYDIGDTLKIELTGTFPYKIDTVANFTFVSRIKSSSLYLVDGSVKFTTELNGVTRNYNIKASQNENGIQITLIDPLYIPSADTKWKLEMQYGALFPDSLDYSWFTQIFANDCFDEISDFIETSANRVCMFNYKHLDYGLAEPEFVIQGNPASDILKLNIDFPIEETVIINIYDLNGNKTTLESGIQLHKGLNELSWDISNYPDGTYLLQIKYQNLVYNLNFIIIHNR